MSLGLDSDREITEKSSPLKRNTKLCNCSTFVAQIHKYISSRLKVSTGGMFVHSKRDSPKFSKTREESKKNKHDFCSLFFFFFFFTLVIVLWAFEWDLTPDLRFKDAVNSSYFVTRVICSSKCLISCILIY